MEVLVSLVKDVVVVAVLLDNVVLVTVVLVTVELVIVVLVAEVLVAEVLVNELLVAVALVFVVLIVREDSVMVVSVPVKLLVVDVCEVLEVSLKDVTVGVDVNETVVSDVIEVIV
jgi:hypothetical protein